MIERTRHQFKLKKLHVELKDERFFKLRNERMREESERKRAH